MARHPGLARRFKPDDHRGSASLWLPTILWQCPAHLAADYLPGHHFFGRFDAVWAQPIQAAYHDAGSGAAQPVSGGLRVRPAFRSHDAALCRPNYSKRLFIRRRQLFWPGRWAFVLFAFGLGFGWPLVLLPLLASTLQRRFTRWTTQNYTLLTRVSGILLVGIGLLGVYTDLLPNIL
ncbi:MAG: hypothetical protein IPJ94_02600 [Chloroflexi bacterium]|nr:hypothetical protein [Chloroflexota bacterium]